MLCSLFQVCICHNLCILSEKIKTYQFFTSTDRFMIIIYADKDTERRQISNRKYQKLGILKKTALVPKCRYRHLGTSLSKSYHVIERFSEDIDLILDWRKIINDEVNPWEERSKTKQDIFNKQINSEAAKFYKEELIPQLNSEMKEKLGMENGFHLIQKMRWWLTFIIRRYLRLIIYALV